MDGWIDGQTNTYAEVEDEDTQSHKPGGSLNGWMD